MPHCAIALACIGGRPLKYWQDKRLPCPGTNRCRERPRTVQARAALSEVTHRAISGHTGLAHNLNAENEMTKIASVVREMARLARRAGATGAAKSRSNQRAALALAMGEMRAAVQSAPHGCPVGPDRACYQADGNIGYIRFAA